MTKVIQIFDSLAGQSQYSFAALLANCLSKKGKVLVIDCNEKAVSTTNLGKDFTDFKTRNSSRLFKRYFQSKENPLKQLHIKAADQLFLIAGFTHLPLSYNKFTIKRFLYNLHQAKKHYDFIVIHAPSVLNRLNKTLFRYADAVFVPFACTHLSNVQLSSLLQTLQVKKIKKSNLILVSQFLEQDIKNPKVFNFYRKIYNKYALKKERVHFLETKFLSPSLDTHLEKMTVMNLSSHYLDSLGINKIEKEAFSFLQNSSPVKIPIRYTVRVIRYGRWVMRVASVLLVFCLLLGIGVNFPTNTSPRVVTLGLLESQNRPDLEYFSEGRQSLYKLIKWAISSHTAIVPTGRQINRYTQEVIFLHNQDNVSSKRIRSGVIPKKTLVFFPPPSNILNPKYYEVSPAHDFFLKTVRHDRSYVTGEWAERGLEGQSSKHKGIDIAAPVGSVIVSPMDGVAYSSDSRHGGITVYIRRGKDILYFAHMKQRFVKTGQLVKKGDPLGTIGLTGRTTGPHVHIGYGIKFPGGEVKIGGSRYTFTDPLFFFYQQNFLSQIEN